MTHPSKRKGNNFEREVVDKAKSFGFEAKRAYASNGESLGLTEDIDIKLSTKVFGSLYLQAKRRKKFPNWLQKHNAHALVLRADNEEAQVLISLNTFLGMLSELDK